MTRRDFIANAGGLAATASLSAFASAAPSSISVSKSEERRDELMYMLDDETDKVSPETYGQYLRNGNTHGLATLERLEAAFDKVLREAKETVVTGDTPAVWSVYNMGCIVKTRQSLFSIDLVHRRDEEFAPLLDFALITHNHNDHWRQGFYGAMNSSHKTMISNFLDNYGATHWGGAEDDKGCGYTRAAREFRIRDVSIRTSLVDHNAVLVDYTTAFEISTGNFVIYHSGDCGNAAKLRPISPHPDLWVVHPFCRMDVVEGAAAVKPKLVAVAHLNELRHAKGHARWAWSQGRVAKARLEAKGTRAIVPLWGDRII